MWPAPHPDGRHGGTDAVLPRHPEINGGWFSAGKEELPWMCKLPKPWVNLQATYDLDKAARVGRVA